MESNSNWRAKPIHEYWERDLDRKTTTVFDGVIEYDRDIEYLFTYKTTKTDQNQPTIFCPN